MAEIKTETVDIPELDELDLINKWEEVTGRNYLITDAKNNELQKMFPKEYKQIKESKIEKSEPKESDYWEKVIDGQKTQFAIDVATALGFDSDRMKMIDFGGLDAKVRKLLPYLFKQLEDNPTKDNAQKIVKAIAENKDKIISDYSERYLSQMGYNAEIVKTQPSITNTLENIKAILNGYRLKLKYTDKSDTEKIENINKIIVGFELKLKYLERANKGKGVAVEEKVAEENPDELNKLLLYEFSDAIVYTINGEYVRREEYPDWTMGGHYYVGEKYHFIPKAKKDEKEEIWVDENLIDKPIDLKVTVVHELLEFKLMKYLEMSYSKAHDFATALQVNLQKSGINFDWSELEDAVASNYEKIKKDKNKYVLLAEDNPKVMSESEFYYDYEKKNPPPKKPSSGIRLNKRGKPITENQNLIRSKGIAYNNKVRAEYLKYIDTILVQEQPLSNRQLRSIAQTLQGSEKLPTAEKLLAKYGYVKDDEGFWKLPSEANVYDVPKPPSKHPKRYELMINAYRDKTGAGWHFDTIEQAAKYAKNLGIFGDTTNTFKITDRLTGKVIADKRAIKSLLRGEMPYPVDEPIPEPKNEVNTEKSVLNQNTDLLGNEKKFWMYVVGDKRIKPQEEINHRSSIKSALTAIHANDLTFLKAIEQGRMTAKDAKIIILSAGLKVPSEIDQLTESKTSKSKELNPSPEVKDDLDTVIKELGYGDFEKDIYLMVKDSPEDYLYDEEADGAKKYVDSELFPDYDEKIEKIKENIASNTKFIQDIDDDIYLDRNAKDEISNSIRKKKKEEKGKFTKEIKKSEADLKELQTAQANFNKFVGVYLYEADTNHFYGYEYALSDKGLAMVKSIEARLQTRKGVKEGYDLFPSYIYSAIPEIKNKIFKKGGTLSYYDNCVHYDNLEELQYIIDNSEEVSRRTFINNVDSESRIELEHGLGYTKGSLPKIQDDYVDYYKSKDLDGNIVYYMRQSGIEYIFSNKGCNIYKEGGGVKGKRLSRVKETKRGNTVKKEDGGNITTDGTKGGLLNGASHAAGGMPVVVDGNREIEVEGNEALIAEEAVNCDCTHTFEGKSGMTNKQILSELNIDGGGVEIKRSGGYINSRKEWRARKLKGGSVDGESVAIGNKDGKPINVSGGQIVITAPTVTGDCKNRPNCNLKEEYLFDNKKLSAREIISIINQEGNGNPI
jgi:hypothetical protein